MERCGQRCNYENYEMRRSIRGIRYVIDKNAIVVMIDYLEFYLLIYRREIIQDPRRV